MPEDDEPDVIEGEPEHQSKARKVAALLHRALVMREPAAIEELKKAKISKRKAD